MKRLFAWSGLPPVPGDDDRPLGDEELRRLSARPGHSIGAHTVNHLALSHQAEDVVRREVEEGRRRLESRLGCAVEGFAYPYGDVSTVALEAAAETGFRWAVTCEARPVEAREEPLKIPRIDMAPAAGRHSARSSASSMVG